MEQWQQPHFLASLADQRHHTLPLSLLRNDKKRKINGLTSTFSPLPELYSICRLHILTLWLRLHALNRKRG